jgi:hypothetical protein
MTARNRSTTTHPLVDLLRRGDCGFVGLIGGKVGVSIEDRHIRNVAILLIVITLEIGINRSLALIQMSA